MDMKHFALPQFSLIEKLSFAEMYVDDTKQVILVKYGKNVVIDLKKAKQVVEMVYPHIVNGAIYGITDATASFLNITREARNYYRSNKSLDISKAHAVVVKELYVRMLASVFIRFDKPVVPTKIFNNFLSAYQFLLNFSEKTADLNSSKVPSE